MCDWSISAARASLYSLFQQATAEAKLAENQLAFKRQETPPSFIQADYFKNETITDMLL